jgi:purine nucleosidase
MKSAGRIDAVPRRRHHRTLAWRGWGLLWVGVLLLFCRCGSLGAPPGPESLPILLDTDIGTDIDDAFALALVMKAPELKLLGVTTVAGDTQARARLAAKLLWTGGGKWREVPVYAGDPGPPLAIEDRKWAGNLEQTRWAEQFSSPSLHLSGGVPFLDSAIRGYPGKVTLVAIGQLTNIADLLRMDPSIKADIQQIVIMGGSVTRGYEPGSPAQPEWNIRCDIPAAQAVFDSGLPLVVTPLDDTMALQLDSAARQRVFAEGPMGDALMHLYRLWGKETPTFCDPMAVTMLVQPGICQSRRLALAVDPSGLTKVVGDRPANALVGLEADPAAFFAFYLGRVAP